jgi:hypothetical protein
MGPDQPPAKSKGSAGVRSLGGRSRLHRGFAAVPWPCRFFGYNAGCRWPVTSRPAKRGRAAPEVNSAKPRLRA